MFYVPALVLAQPEEIYNAAELEIALQKVNVVGSVLYIAAHPDDENTGLLAYLSKGRKYRTAYLSLTRGDGGQNLIGPEKGAEIGLIRTQELLQARRFDGAEQYFTRAIDFGYSKTATETFSIWGKEEILADIVWVIRKFRPDVIITRFTPDQDSGHGHHTASAILAQEAFLAAADPNRFTEQLKYVQPWQTKRVFWNSWRPGPDEAKKLVRVDIGVYIPLLGKSFTEIAAESRSMHKSQGFGAAGRRGESLEYFALLNGAPAATDIMDGINTTWERIPGGKQVEQKLQNIISVFDPKNPSASIPALVDVYAEMDKLNNDYVAIKKQELLHIIQSCAGLWMEVMADDYAVSPGDSIRVQFTIVNRSTQPFYLDTINAASVAVNLKVDTPLLNNKPAVVKQFITIPADFPISQPYWLQAPAGKGLFKVNNMELTGLAENPVNIPVQITIRCNGRPLTFSVPVLYRWTDRADGELYRPLEVRPPVTMNLEDKVSIFTGNEAKEITVKIKSHTRNKGGVLTLSGAGNWQVMPASIPFVLTDKYEEKKFIFTVTPPKAESVTTLQVHADINGSGYTHSLVEISHPHIKLQTWLPLCQVQAVKLNVEKQHGNIGYIMGSGDEVPQVLKNLGYDVTLLEDAQLDNGSLDRFDAIIAGIRAYNTRERLKYVQPQLLEYVKNGGTLIVQYNVAFGLLTDNLGPYPLTLGQDRVSVEEAPVTFLKPDHQLLNYPNKITRHDFDNWVQERGLYFATQWDQRYTPVLACNDPGEPEKPGGMLFTRYGKGVYIYSGYAWFRQLPAGSPGACRLFINMLEAGKYHD